MIIEENEPISNIGNNHSISSSGQTSIEHVNNLESNEETELDNSLNKSSKLNTSESDSEN